MTEVIGVRFKKVGKIYYFDPCGVSVEEGQAVIVETARGIEYGEVASANRQVEDEHIVQPLKKLIRTATKDDEKRLEANRLLEKDAFRICQQKIQSHKLEMKLIDVEYTFDNNKLLFYFSAEGRVDFRELVKDLAYVFKTRIELRQIGVRDESKMIGGLGICGKPFCCSSFLGEFHPVSIKMAKDQGLSLNPAKISGTCGRLMCCLKYEQAAYDQLLKVTPRHGAAVKTPDGPGVVIDSNLLRGMIKVRLDAKPDAPATVYPLSQLNLPGKEPVAGAAQKEDGPNQKSTQPAASPARAEAPSSEHAPSQQDAANKPQAQGQQSNRPRPNRRGRHRRSNNKPNQAGQQTQDGKPKENAAPAPVSAPPKKPDIQ